MLGTHRSITQDDVGGVRVEYYFVRAFAWLLLASSQGLDETKAARVRLSELMTPDEITEARALARLWKSTNYSKEHVEDFEDATTAYEKRDYETAYRLLRPQAEQGLALAQINLGGMYRKGEGVMQDYKEAVKWYRLAAEQGEAEAQFNLGVMYLNGEGVVQDHIRAFAYLLLASIQWHEGARQERQLLSEQLTSDQIAEAQALAREWAAKYNKQ